MDDSLGVSCVGSIGDFRRECQQYFQIERPASNGVLERLAVQELHGDKRLALRLAPLINRANIRVIEGRSGARLATKSFQSLRVNSSALAPTVAGSEIPHERRSGFRLRAQTPARRLNLRLQW